MIMTSRSSSTHLIKLPIMDEVSSAILFFCSRDES